MRPQQIQAHSNKSSRKTVPLPTILTSCGPDLHWQDWVTCPSCSPSHCHPMVSCSLSLSYLLIPHRELVAAPGSLLCHWGTKGDSGAPSGTISTQNNATPPLHFAVAFLLAQVMLGQSFKQEVGHRPSLLSASATYVGFLTLYHTCL